MSNGIKGPHISLGFWPDLGLTDEEKEIISGFNDAAKKQCGNPIVAAVVQRTEHGFTAGYERDGFGCHDSIKSLAKRVAEIQRIDWQP